MTGQRTPRSEPPGDRAREPHEPADAAGAATPAPAARHAADPPTARVDRADERGRGTGGRGAARAERPLTPVPEVRMSGPPALLSAEAIDEELEKLKITSKVRKRHLKELRKAGALLGDVLARGFLNAYLLHLCNEHPRHGNEILHEIEARTDGLWAPSSGGVYTALVKLEKRGLLEGSWEAGVTRDRRVYRITAQGRDALEEFRALAPPRIAAASRVLAVVARDLLEEPPPRQRS